MRILGLARVALLAATLAACGQASDPIEIPARDLPFTVARAPTPRETAAPARSFWVYFTRDQRLVRVRREIRADTPSAEAAIRALLGGPTGAERQQRIGTELPVDVRLLDLGADSTTAHIDLSSEFEAPASPELIALRVAQVVWTLTEAPEIQAIRFSIDGEQIAVTTADGTSIERPATRLDYGSFAPA